MPGEKAFGTIPTSVPKSDIKKVRAELKKDFDEFRRLLENAAKASNELINAPLNKLIKKVDKVESKTDKRLRTLEADMKTVKTAVKRYVHTEEENVRFARRLLTSKSIRALCMALLAREFGDVEGHLMLNHSDWKDLDKPEIRDIETIIRKVLNAEHA
jgi:hypothetical protein